MATNRYNSRIQASSLRNQYRDLLAEDRQSQWESANKKLEEQRKAEEEWRRNGASLSDIDTAGELESRRIERQNERDASRGSVSPLEQVRDSYIDAYRASLTPEQLAAYDRQVETSGKKLMDEQARWWDEQQRQTAQMLQQQLKKENSFSGLVGNLGDLAMSPITASVKGVKELSGQVVDDALGMDGFARTLDRVADKDIAAQKGVTDAVTMMSEGDVSAGLRHSDDGIREFARDPAVAPVLAAAATYFGQGYLAPVLTGAASAAGAGAASGILGGAAAGAATGAGIAASQGESNLGNAALAGGVAGGIGGAGNWAKGMTDSAVANSAIQGAGNQALGVGLTGGNSEEILDAAQTGAISGAMRPVLGGVNKEYGQVASNVSGGLLNTAIKGGDSEDYQRAGTMGLLTGVGGELAGKAGSSIAGLLGKEYYKDQAMQEAQERRNQMIEQKKAQQQQMIAQRKQQMLNDPRYKQYQMYQKIKSNPVLSRYNPNQLQQLFARYNAQKRG